MTQTMLERAARAVGDVVGYRGDDIIATDSLAMDIARAVLMSVRDDRDGVMNTWIDLDISENAHPAKTFTAMIDQILNETPE